MDATENANPNGSEGVNAPARTSVKRERSDDDSSDGEIVTRNVSQRLESETRKRIEEAKASIREHVTTLRGSNDEDILENAMGGLHDCLRIIDGRSEKQEVFQRFGGPALVVSAMDRYQGLKNLQIYGIGVVIDATCGNDGLKSTFADVGGNQAILKAMANYFTSKPVQLNCLKALFNLSSLPSNAELLVKELDALPPIMKAITKFSQDTDVVYEGCHVLWRFSNVEANTEQLRQANVVTALASAIDGHKDEPYIQKYARRAMTALM